MYANSKARGAGIMLQSLMVSEEMVITSIWGCTEMGVSTGNFFPESVSLVPVCTLSSPPRGSAVLAGADGRGFCYRGVAVQLFRDASE